VFLGIGVTAGVAVQAAGLIPALNRMGFNFRPRFDFRRSELTQMWGVASWTLLYVLAQQVAVTVYNNLAVAAGARGVQEGLPAGVGSTPWQTAYAFFQLPYAVVAISIITAVFPQMTESAARGRFDRLIAQLRESLSLSLSLMLPAIALLFGAASEICFVLFAHGNTRVADAEVIAQVLRVFAIALLPFSVLQLLQRGFYAQQDTRTPALISIASTGTGAITALVMSAILPTRDVILGIAGAQALSWTIGCILSIVLLGRLGRLGGGQVASVFVRSAISALAMLVVVELIHLVVVPHLGGSKPLTALMLILEGVLGGGVFLICSVVLRVREVSRVIAMVRGKLGR
jgi:putative peptidoglycan lipid II flippase